MESIPLEAGVALADHYAAPPTAFVIFLLLQLLHDGLRFSFGPPLSVESSSKAGHDAHQIGQQIFSIIFRQIDDFNRAVLAL